MTMFNRQARAALDVFIDYDINDMIFELDNMTPEDHKTLARSLRQFFNEPSDLSTEQVIARHRKRLLYLIN